MLTAPLVLLVERGNALRFTCEPSRLGPNDVFFKSRTFFLVSIVRSLVHSMCVRAESYDISSSKYTDMILSTGLDNGTCTVQLGVVRILFSLRLEEGSSGGSIV